MATFLVTGTGGGTGFASTQALLALHHDVIAVDSDPLAAGLHLPEVIPHTVPQASDPSYLDHLLKLCAAHSVDAVIAGTDEEQTLFTREHAAFVRHRLQTWLPSPDASRRCVDKWEFFHTARDAGIPVPETCLGSVSAVPFTADGFVVKPRRGRGSRGVAYAGTTEEALFRAHHEPDSIIQVRLRGREFTADCLTAAGGETVVALRYRDRVRAGICVVGTTFHDDAVASTVARTISAVGLEGPSCVQGFVDSDVDPRVSITEINARFAGSFMLTEAAGAGIFRRYTETLLHGSTSYDGFSYEDGVRMVRYWSEFIS